MEGGSVWDRMGAGWVGSLYSPLYSRRMSAGKEGGRDHYQATETKKVVQNK